MVPDSGIRIGPLLDPAFALSGAPWYRFSPKIGGRIWHQTRSAFVPSFSPLRVQANLGSPEQTLQAPARCSGPEHADRSEPSASCLDPPAERNALKGIAPRRQTEAAARCVRERSSEVNLQGAAAGETATGRNADPLSVLGPHGGPASGPQSAPRLLVVCLSFLGRLLVVCWSFAGRLLVVCWSLAGRLLVVCWSFAGRLLVVCL